MRPSLPQLADLAAENSPQSRAEASFLPYGSFLCRNFLPDNNDDYHQDGADWDPPPRVSLSVCVWERKKWHSLIIQYNGVDVTKLLAHPICRHDLSFIKLERKSTFSRQGDLRKNFVHAYIYMPSFAIWLLRYFHDMAPRTRNENVWPWRASLSLLKQLFDNRRKKPRNGPSVSPAKKSFYLSKKSRVLRPRRKRERVVYLRGGGQRFHIYKYVCVSPICLAAHFPLRHSPLPNRSRVLKTDTKRSKKHHLWGPGQLSPIPPLAPLGTTICKFCGLPINEEP